MALVVEDGTGMAGADSYLSLSAFATYCADRNLVTTATDAVKEAALRNATLYIDSNYRFRGAKGSATQALEFPRAAGTVDRDGLAIAAVPARLKWATAEAAFYALGTADGDLLPAAQAGIKSESVGPISTTYMDGVPVAPVYGKVDNILRPLTRLDGPVPVPRMAQPTDEPFFGVTLHDSIDGPTPGATEQETAAALDT